MSQQVSSESAAVSGEKSQITSRLQGISVMAAVLLPMLAAYIVFYTGAGMPDNRVNQGELLQPARSLEQLPLLGADGGALNLLVEEPKWRYLILGGDDCAAECDQLLYTSRQVHIRLGEKANRVERLLVTERPLSEARMAALHEQHPRLRFAVAESSALDSLFAGTSHAGLDETSALLVDQRGFAMMVYDNSHSGNQLLKDIKKLLKYSTEQ